MKRELVESYFDWNEIRLEAYLRIDPQLIELEGECEKTMDELKPYIENMVMSSGRSLTGSYRQDKQ